MGAAPEWGRVRVRAPLAVGPLLIAWQAGPGPRWILPDPRWGAGGSDDEPPPRCCCFRQWPACVQDGCGELRDSGQQATAHGVISVTVEVINDERRVNVPARDERSLEQWRPPPPVFGP